MSTALWNGIIADHAASQVRASKPATIDTSLERYRDHRIDFADSLAPHTYEGVHEDYEASYEGPEDGWVASHPIHTGNTLDEVRAEIDAWHEEQVSA